MIGDPVIGSFTAAGQSATYWPRVSARSTNTGEFDIWLSNAGTATIQLEATPDNGVTWYEISAAGTQLYKWSYAGTNLVETAQECKAGIGYRLNCLSCTGEVDYTIAGPQA
jgi:hypothetical protein